MIMKNFAAQILWVLRRDDNNYVYKEFQQVGHGPGGFYEMNLIRKNNPPPLTSNKSNSLGRLSSLVKDLIQEPVRDIQ